MRRLTRAALAALLVGACAIAAALAGAGRTTVAAAADGSCRLSNGAGPVQHVVYLQFDNTHYRRDAPNVLSDLEQMPHLLGFLQQNGTLFTNDHTEIISHTGGGILSTLTGLYPGRQGGTVSNAYGFFRPDGSVGFSSVFKYWTDKVDATDPLPNMITDGQRNTPAPWVPFTRAGCDVGGVGTANIELENTSTAATGDVTTVFGAGSPQYLEAQSNPHKALTDLVGIAIHCAQTSDSRCAGNANAKPDLLPDEPGGYSGYQALFGAQSVDPAITGGSPCVNDTAGQPVTDPDGNCGFPGFDGMLAKNTLGYVEQMQENGVPVTYGYISDAHDLHTPNTTSDSYVSSAQGPGESGHDAQLAAYDQAFQQFFDNLSAHGIDRSNTVFVVTVDEGDHFAGGVGTPAGDGSLSYTHANCATVTACPSNQIGEVNFDLTGPNALPAGEPAFSVHSDSSPTVYVNGNPGRTDARVRQLERDVAKLQVPDPYVSNGQAVPLTVALADPVEEQTLHMVNSDPARTPTFTLWANDDFFVTSNGSAPSCGGNPCVSPGFAWNHGDIQPEIANTWVGFVGPGVAQRGVDSTTWTDHANVRPTLLALTGLTDDYAHDGFVLTQALTQQAVPQALRESLPLNKALADAYEQVNAPFGEFDQATLKASTKALASGSATDDDEYTRTEAAIQALTSKRDQLASQIEGQLEGAAFSGRRIPPVQALAETAAARLLVVGADALAVATR
jgi:hypothetical protein